MLGAAMPPSARIVIALLLLIGSSHAQAGDASFRVAIRVLPEQVPGRTPVDLPTPPQARTLPPNGHAKRLLVRGSPGDARRFYDHALPELGFFLVREDADGSVWIRSDVRAELLFYPVVGGEEATGVHVVLSPSEPSAGAKHR